MYPVPAGSALCTAQPAAESSSVGEHPAQRVGQSGIGVARLGEHGGGVAAVSLGMLVLRDLFNSIRRFDELAAHLHIARNVLTRRLTALIEADLVDRVPYREPGRRERHEYRLTAAGRDLRPVILAMLEWGDRHLAGPDGPPMRVEHLDCGSPVHVEVRCDEGHLVEPATRLRTVPGPGARRAG